MVGYALFATPLILSLILRVYAIDFGRSYGVLFGDELLAARETSEAVADLQVSHLRRNGWLFYLICAPIQYLLSIGHHASLNPRLVYDVPIFQRVLAGRILNVLFGVATVALAFLIVRRLWGRHAASWSALALALSPTTVVEGHFNATATSLNTWLLLTVFFLVRSHQDGLRFLIGALAAGGLAFLTKPNGVIALVLVSLFAVWQVGEHRVRLGRIPRPLTLAVVVLMVASGLLTATRWRLLRNVISTFLWTYERGTRPVHAWAWLLRYEGLVIVLGFVGMLISRLEASLRWPIAAAAVIYGVGSLFFQVFFVRWLMPLVALMALFLGGAARKLRDVVPGRAAHGVTVLLCGIFALMGWQACSLVSNLTTDVREQTWHWMQENVPPGSRVAVEGLWLHTGAPAQTYRVETLDKLEDSPDAYVQDGFNFLTVWGGELDYYNWRAVRDPVKPEERYPRLYDRFEPVYRGEGSILHIPVAVSIEVLEVPANPVYRQGEVTPGAGWHANETEEGSGAESRWMTDAGQVFYNRPTRGDPGHVLSFDAYVFRDNGEIEVRVNQDSAGSLVLASSVGLQHVELPVKLDPGLNEIRLISRQGCDRPIVVDPTSRDRRCLSIKVTNLSLGPVDRPAH